MRATELFKLQGKTAIVTGGARNLGYDMALALAEVGADLVITSRQLRDARSSAEEISSSTSRKVLPVEVDVADEKQVVAMVVRPFESMVESISLLTTLATQERVRPNRRPLRIERWISGGWFSKST
jgi:NAD(P)-dependent dehydrogenase (short-subunit alcohol dehydrogenase family)